jgi:serine/threonine protein kinase
VHAQFTTKSDVWAYGVVLWEMVTLGHVPYPGISPGEVKTFIVDQRGKKHRGFRVGVCIGTMANTERFRPVGCPRPLLALMEQCWRFDPKDRPTFEQLLREHLLVHMHDSFRQLSFVLNGDRQPTTRAQEAARDRHRSG